MASWRGWWVSRASGAADAPARIELRTDLDDEVLGDDLVTVDVEYSSLNYKDALALTGRPGIVRSPALIPGIDLVGTVARSDDPAFAPGDRVLVNGRGLGETHHGGLAERARVPADFLVPVPSSMSSLRAAAIGTAGFTAMLAVLALERAGSTDEVVVTGASGGVGSIAVAVLARLGHRVTAVTGRGAEHDRLRALGAADILERSAFEEPGKPLQSQRWGGAVDTVGGGILATLLAQMRYGSTVAACGNANSSSSTVSLMPFILRSVTLAGINSVETPRELRLEAWRRLDRDLDPALLDDLTTVVPLADAVATAEALLDGRGHGRAVVDVTAR